MKKIFTPLTPRRCQVCKTIKPLKEFSKAKSLPGGATYRCKECERILSVKAQWSKLSVTELKRQVKRDSAVIKLKREYIKERIESELWESRLNEITKNL